jgi:hypothetical protein
LLSILLSSSTHFSYRFAAVRSPQKVDDSSGLGEANCSVVLLMVRDAYANYVVQTALDVVPEGTEKKMLLDELNSHAAQLVRAITRATISAGD